MNPRKKSAEAASGARARSTTESEPQGAVMRVDNPLDLWYLCEKISYAQRFPKQRSDGQLMYQRVVTQLIRLDDKLFDYQFPYIGEVGYDMTRNPPAPIMSRRQPHRPSQFPLGRYAAIKNRIEVGLYRVHVERTRELLSRDELEASLTPAMREAPGAAKPLPDVVRQQLRSMRGLFRIPDVVRIRNFMLRGPLAFSQDNLDAVIEIKFAGDRLTPFQTEAYQQIAGHPKKFRLLETHTCLVDDRRKRDWLREGKKEPVYRPVGLAGVRNLLCLRPQVEAYPLLEGQAEAEYQALQHYLNPAEHPLPEGPQWVAIDPAREAEQERQRQHTQAGLGLALGAPMYAIAGAALAAEAGGAVLASAGAAVTEGGALLGQVAGQLVRYPRQVVASVALGSSGYAMAEQDTEPAPIDRRWLDDFVNDRVNSEQDYLYWPD